MFKYCIAAVITVIAVPVWAGGLQTRDKFETLAAQTPWRVENGRETREILLDGVKIFQERSGDKISVITIDQSGRGAVMCSKMILTKLLQWVEQCHPEDAEWKTHLSTSLDHINDFIVANSLTPVSKQDLNADLEKRLRSSRESARTLPAQTMGKICGKDSDGGRMFEAMKKAGYSRLQANTDQLLSVPRPPVLNPCL